MQKVLHLKTTVLPGGRIEIDGLELETGESIEVIVLHSPPSLKRSALDVLSEAAGQRLFKTAEDVEAYLHHERESWER
jgi:hypothetical protein